jgi:hypothetical protein
MAATHIAGPMIVDFLDIRSRKIFVFQTITAFGYQVFHGIVSIYP